VRSLNGTLGDITLVRASRNKMTRLVDFSGNARVYDKRHGAAADDMGLKKVCEVARLEVGGTVLDIGAGTGRVSIPLSDLGYKVIAVEPAAGMLEQLRLKANGRLIETHQAGGSHLPVASGAVDAVSIARLLYLTPDWHQILDEVGRVLKPDGVLLHEWGNGNSDEPWVLVREKARSLFEAEGMVSPFHPGARQESEVEGYLASAGFHLESRVGIGSGVGTTIRQFLQRLVDGELSYIWDVPTDIRAKCLPHLRQWVETTLELDVPVPMPKLIEWTVYRRHVAQQPHAAIGSR
jgi:SAM-dependent methyltransferase